MTDHLRQARARWRYTGQTRPPFAIAPQPGQESVWDYPRPPRIERDTREVVVCMGESLIARSRQSLRVLETASPPTFYLPRRDLRMELLTQAAGHSYCEWKGEARYWSIDTSDRQLENVAWSYPQPHPGFELLADHYAFYPAHVECYVSSARVEPQPGRFYGGWVTPELVGPFKGEAGTAGW